MNKLKNKVAVVTGGGGTLCSEMARELGRLGMKVALIGRTMEKLKKVENEISASGGTAISASGDVSSAKDMKNAASFIRKELGPCKVLINGAGGNQMDAITTVNEFAREELDRKDPDLRGFFNLKMDRFLDVIDVNTLGTVIPSQIFARDMAGNKGGSIINFASMTSFRALSRVPAYGMAKTAIVFFTQWLASYLAPAGIRVNAIAPGYFINDRNRYRLMKPEGGYTERGDNILRLTPLKRFGKAGELTGCMKWLIDEDSSGFVTGITIPVDGGFLSCPGV